ncbi:hypothetical protein WA158_005732 [Blastocystis sp. Blastoise]
MPNSTFVTHSHSLFNSVQDYVFNRNGKRVIQKILIANNGIAAVKCIRSIRKWSYETFETDKAIEFIVMATPEDLAANAEYIRMADEYVEVQGGPNTNNYANVTRIVEIAEVMGADAVWAGWGHASENPSLPDSLKEKGIVFIGPPSGPMRALGDKIGSTIIAQSANVPTIAWNGSNLKLDISPEEQSSGHIHVPEDIYEQADVKTVSQALECCESIGYPCMIKASEGGGGKGIRKIGKREEVEAGYRAVQNEVPGSPILIMKYADQSRHLEVQLVSDEYNNSISLSGRDCSVQRRHQKIIEEGPPLAPSADTWIEMTSAAVRLAKMVGYVNAGTVEYLYMDDGKFSFLELNPRLQVEHPVTEMITDVNLPAVQLQIAMGIPLYAIPCIRNLYNKQEYDMTPIDFDTESQRPPRGHVIACRITAENPDAGFTPTSGAIRELNFRSTVNVWGYFSVDSSGRVHEYADSQFGHLFSWGTTRNDARRNMVQALREFSIRGDIHTTVDYLLGLIQSDAYVDNKINTNWLDSCIKNNIMEYKPESIYVVLVTAACSTYTKFHNRKEDFISYLKRGQVPPRDLLIIYEHLDLIYDDIKYPLDIYVKGENMYTILCNDSSITLQVREMSDKGFLVTFSGRKHMIYIQDTPAGLKVSFDGTTCMFSQEYDPSTLRSPNTGKLARYLVDVGDKIKRGEPYAEIEVMKMYMPLLAQEDGEITQLYKAVGTLINQGDILCNVKINDSSKIKKIDIYKEKLPLSSNTNSIRNLKPHMQIKDYMNVLLSCIDGFYVPRDIYTSCVTFIYDSCNTPSIIINEFMDIYSTIESKIPEQLKLQINLFIDTYPKSGDMSIFLENNEETKKNIFVEKMNEILHKYLNECQDEYVKKELNNNLTPLFNYIDNFQYGLQEYIMGLLVSIIKRYIQREMKFNKKKDIELFIELRKNCNGSNEDYENIWNIMLGHNGIKHQNELILLILKYIYKYIYDIKTNNTKYHQILQELALLQDKQYAKLSLEARQLLIRKKMPTYEEDLTIVHNLLAESIKEENKEQKDNIISTIIDKPDDYCPPLIDLMNSKYIDIRELALKCYVERIYKSYMLRNVLKIDISSISPSCMGYKFMFKSENQEMPTGLKPSGSFDSLKSLLSPSSSSPSLDINNNSNSNSNSIENESDEYVNGIIVYINTIDEIEQNIYKLIDLFDPSMQLSTTKSPIHIILGDFQGLSQEDIIHKMETIIKPYSEMLIQANIGRISISMNTIIDIDSYSHERPFTSTYTFRQRLGFQEDTLVRHIEPPLVYHLEIQRMRNFNISLMPTPNRSIHLYYAFPKSNPIIRGSPMPVRNRFFVRAVCRTLDQFESSCVGDTLPGAEKVFDEALDALEYGMNRLQIEGRDKNVRGNQIFINMLPVIHMDSDYIEKILYNLYKRYIDRLTSLKVSQVEIHLNPILSPESNPLPIRMVATDPTTMALRVDTYVETKDTPTSIPIFTSISEGVGEVGGDWDGHSVNMAYPVLEYLERERAFALSTSNTLYCYDFLELIQRLLIKQWDQYKLQCKSDEIYTPSTVMKVKELILDQKDGKYVLKEVQRVAGKNTIGMIAWLLTLYTPLHPKGREIIVIANDITFKAGSFGTLEDKLFELASKYARMKKIPRIFFAANSGARIGLADEIQKIFKVKWIQEDNPEKGFEYLYVNEEDYEKIKDSITVSKVQLPTGENVYKINTIIGLGKDLGVENLQGSGTIAGETSRAYDDIFTLTYVSGRSVGIGAYLVRLGQRTIQKINDAPILLTGFEALNKLMGKHVYTSNSQLGGTDIMYPNGVSHLIVNNDIEGVEKVLEWLNYIPAYMGAPLPIKQLTNNIDIINRSIDYMPAPHPYDVRDMLRGYQNTNTDETKSFVYGFFDKDSFMETLAGWAKTVVVGRARLGGIPVGVIASENRTMDLVIPADPADPGTEETIVKQAGGVWYPDSSYKTAQAINDFNNEGLPLFIFANWRGFSGGARDMYDEILKYGSYIVEALVNFKQPIFVYIPPYSELRGGAFVVVDSSINSEMMEMYAAQKSRGGVLEPAGAAAIKFRAKDKISAMHRLDHILIEMDRELEKMEENEKKDELLMEIKNREAQLMTSYTHIGETFADLHDTPERMYRKHVIRKLLNWEQSRIFFYWRLLRRIEEINLCKKICSIRKGTLLEASKFIEQWYEMSDDSINNIENYQDDDERVYKWLIKEKDNIIKRRLLALEKMYIRNEVMKYAENHAESVAEGVLDAISNLNGDEKERVLSILRRGILFRSRSNSDPEEDGNIIEF